jgi:putative tricarboxylic transport membrane protein
MNQVKTGGPASVSPSVGNHASPDVLERRRARLGIAMGVLVVAVGAAAIVGSASLGYWTPLGPGPGFFPLCLGVLLCVLGAGWLVQQWRGRHRSAARDGDSGTELPVGPGAEAMEAPPEYSLPTVIAILVSLCVLAGTLELLGYQLAMFLFLLFHLLVLGRRRLLLSLAIALAGSIGVFVMFTRLLGVPLPASSLPFLAGLGL